MRRASTTTSPSVPAWKPALPEAQFFSRESLIKDKFRVSYFESDLMPIKQEPTSGSPPRSPSLSRSGDERGQPLTSQLF
jgi:hypothetical protein